jgi:hypothetical protein
VHVGRTSHVGGDRLARTSGEARLLAWLAHRRVEFADDAVTCSTGDFLIVWTVFAADDDALDKLLRAAREQPDARGSIASNFDPAILWRRDEFLAASGRRSGMAQAGCRAMDHGGTGPSRPSRPKVDR